MPSLPETPSPQTTHAEAGVWNARGTTRQFLGKARKIQSHEDFRFMTDV